MNESVNSSSSLTHSSCVRCGARTCPSRGVHRIMPFLIWMWVLMGSMVHALRELPGLDAVRGADEQQVGGAHGEQPDRDHAGDLVQLALERDRIRDLEIVDIEDVVAVIGHEALAPHGAAAARAELPAYQSARHGDDLDGEGKAPERRDHLRVVEDAHEALRGRGEDLLAGEGAAAALDELPGGGRLVGAVDVQADSTRLVQIRHLESRGAQPGAGRLRARYRAAHAPGLRREGV